MKTENLPLIAILLSWLALLLSWSLWLLATNVYSVLVVVVLQVTSLALIVRYFEMIFAQNGPLGKHRALAQTMLFVGLVAIFNFFWSAFWSGVRITEFSLISDPLCQVDPTASRCILEGTLQMTEVRLWLPLGLVNFLRGLR